jgi:hypothetical protein
MLSFFLILGKQNWRFVRFSTRGVHKHQKQLPAVIPCQTILAEKAERKKTFFLSSFPIDFFNRVFDLFSA